MFKRIKEFNKTHPKKAFTIAMFLLVIGMAATFFISTGWHAALVFFYLVGVFLLIS